MSSVAVAASAVASLPRIVVVGPLPPPYHGGAVATANVLRSQLARQCRLVHLDTTDRRGLDNIGRFDPGNVLLALRHTAGMLAALARRPAAVYVPVAQNRLGFLRDAALILPALLLGRPVLLHLHGSGIRELHDHGDPATRLLLRLVLARAARVIVLGEALRGPLLELIPQARVVVLPNGVDDLFPVPPVRRCHAVPLRVLYLGNIREAKGYRIAIEAVKMLRCRGLEVELHMAGGFSSRQDRNEAESALAELGRAAVLHGAVEGSAKRRLLEEADVFVMPSYSEGHPYVVLEAMSAGLPIVASALPTLAETVEDGESGFLVPAGDSSACAAALEKLAADADLRLAMGRAARRRYEERYSYEVWSSGLCAIVEGALR